jgi:DNA-binding CsgD family transcriptional regulator
MAYPKFYVNVLAQDFITWFTYHMRGKYPVETFYDRLLFDNSWIWTDVEITQKDKQRWRISVDLTDKRQEASLEIEDALACYLTQIKSTPNNPRLEVQVSWSEFFPASTWALLQAVVEAYPEAAAQITAWKNSKMGKATHMAWVISYWFEKYVAPTLDPLTRQILNDLESEQSANDVLKWPNIVDSTLKVITTEESPGVDMFQKFSHRLRKPPGEYRFWIDRMMSRFQLKLSEARLPDAKTVEARKHANIGYLIYARIAEAWEKYEKELEAKLSVEEKPPDFEELLYREGLKDEVSPRGLEPLLRHWDDLFESQHFKGMPFDFHSAVTEFSERVDGNEVGTCSIMLQQEGVEPSMPSCTVKLMEEGVTVWMMVLRSPDGDSRMVIIGPIRELSEQFQEVLDDLRLLLSDLGYLRIDESPPMMNHTSVASVPPDAQLQDNAPSVRNQVQEADLLIGNREAVLLLICQGLGNSEIANRLNLVEGTVKNYVSELYKLFDIPDNGGYIERRNFLCEKAEEQGLID